jgi:F420-non-reducing hydrogenase iron-sulfur subunit
MAGVSRLQYTSDIRLIRVMCSGRVDLEFILEAFLTGQDGVFIGGCKLNECNYVTHGNYDALSNTYLFKKIMKHIGLNPDRLSIEFMSGGDGNILAEVIDSFSLKIKDFGPLGKSEGIDKETIKQRLKDFGKLLPYLKLVERERLRVPLKSEEEYNKFWNSDEIDNLFNDLISKKFAISQIMSLLKTGPLSTGEISKRLDLNPSEVSRHMNVSTRQGLVRYDIDRKCYALA